MRVSRHLHDTVCKNQEIRTVFGKYRILRVWSTIRSKWLQTRVSAVFFRRPADGNTFGQNSSEMPKSRNRTGASCRSSCRRCRRSRSSGTAKEYLTSSPLGALLRTAPPSFYATFQRMVELIALSAKFSYHGVSLRDGSCTLDAVWLPFMDGTVSSSTSTSSGTSSCVLLPLGRGHGAC